jgi:hypothetical protein
MKGFLVPPTKVRLGNVTAITPEDFLAQNPYRNCWHLATR